MKKSVKETVTDIIGSIIKATPVIDDSTTLTSLGLDSLDSVQFLMSVESAFHIRLPDDTLQVIPTVNEFINAVEKIIEDLSKNDIVPAETPKSEVVCECGDSANVIECDGQNPSSEPEVKESPEQEEKAE